jgi:hypothetical protein
MNKPSPMVVRTAHSREDEMTVESMERVPGTTSDDMMKMWRHCGEFTRLTTLLS